MNLTAVKIVSPQGCHKIFGSVTLDRAEIGLYPYWRCSSQNDGGDFWTEWCRQDTKEFLTQFFEPTLNSFETNENPALPVDVSTYILSEFNKNLPIIGHPSKR